MVDNLLVFVKLNNNVPTIQYAIGYVRESLQSNCERFYYTNDKDTATIRDLLDAMHDDDLEGHHVIFLEYSYAQELLIEKLYVGNIHYINYQNSRYRIHYQVTHEITSPLVIDNFMRYSTLSLERDFEEDSHISIEDSAPLMRQLYYAINCPQNYLRQDVTYSPLEGEGQFSEFAQRNEYCKRLFNIAEPSVARGEYQRDYDRIVHSKAFRHMVDKAQIFSASKGDHYRTRMTHTLGVTQIARSIASRLHMNVPLTEAIALAHDLGHTPFGHQGERTLDQLARKYAEIGFKHNFQSLKVASVLEERYVQCTGMDLSVQVLEGIWKHTKIRKHRDAPLLCEIEDFLPYGIAEEQIALLHPEDNFCSTIEGQIVFIADEIAQRSHDLDDALTAGLLSMDNVLDALSLKKTTYVKNAN